MDEHRPRPLLGALSIVWASWWALVGALGLAENGISAETIILALFFFALAAAPLPSLVRRVRARRQRRRLQGGGREIGLLALASRRRARRRRREERRAAIAAAATAAAAGERLARLPADVRDGWQRLEGAWDVASQLSEEGFVEPAALFEARRSITRLEELLVADARTEAVGGSRSTRLRRQLDDLTGLLVALADEAVEHQAALADDSRGPATLREARERLASSREAYGELEGQPGT